MINVIHCDSGPPPLPFPPLRRFAWVTNPMRWDEIIKILAQLVVLESSM